MEHHTWGMRPATITTNKPKQNTEQASKQAASTPDSLCCLVNSNRNPLRISPC